MTCSEEHWIDNDPCPNCGSTRTGISDEHPGLTECDDCDEVFDVEDPTYGRPDDDE